MAFSHYILYHFISKPRENKPSQRWWLTVLFSKQSFYFIKKAHLKGGQDSWYLNQSIVVLLYLLKMCWRISPMKIFYWVIYKTTIIQINISNCDNSNNRAMIQYFRSKYIWCYLEDEMVVYLDICRENTF